MRLYGDAGLSPTTHTKGKSAEPGKSYPQVPPEPQEAGGQEPKPECQCGNRSPSARGAASCLRKKRRNGSAITTSEPSISCSGSSPKARAWPPKCSRRSASTSPRFGKGLKRSSAAA